MAIEPKRPHLLSEEEKEFLKRSIYRKFSMDTFFGNAQELLNSLEQEQKNPDWHHHPFNRFDKEVSRQLHNFLAAAMTIVDHTRVLMNEHYTETDIYKEFRARTANEFTNNSLTRFIQDLRNYTIHRGLPLPSEVGGPPETKRMRLHVPTLLEWGGWKSEAKSYLAASGEYIELLPLVVSYTKLIRQFQEGLDDLLWEHHMADWGQTARKDEG
jgi:hypothetical protein